MASITMFALKTSFKPLLLKGVGGSKSVSRGDCEYQGRKLLRLLPQLRPRIRPVATEWLESFLLPNSIKLNNIKCWWFNIVLSMLCLKLIRKLFGGDFCLLADLPFPQFWDVNCKWQVFTHRYPCAVPLTYILSSYIHIFCTKQNRIYCKGSN